MNHLTLNILILKKLFVCVHINVAGCVFHSAYMKVPAWVLGIELGSSAL